MAGECGVDPTGKTLRALWWMAAGGRESRRHLALDVRAMLTAKKFDVAAYIATGSINEHRQHELPDTPQMREALKQAREEKERLANRDK